MADLSTINNAQPADGEAVSNGASRIRETRDAVATSFDVEHALAGAHTFMYGAPGTKPAAGNAGRMFWDTTNERVQRDDGAVWRMLHAMQGQYIFTSGATAALTISTFNTVQTLSIDMPRDGKLLVVGSLEFLASATAYAFQMRFRADGATVLDPQARQFYYPAIQTSHLMIGMVTNLTGSDNGTTHSITLEVNPATQVGTTAQARFLTGLVL